MDTQEAYRKQLADKTAEIVAETLYLRRKDLYSARREFAETLGVQESTVLRTELGRYHFKIESLVEYCVILRLDPGKVVAEAYKRAKAEVEK